MNQASTTTRNETELVAQAKLGDRHAFGELVRQHHPGVISVVYQLCGDLQLAEDAAQEAFIRAWQNLARYRPQAGSSKPFRNWLYRIATNAALDMLRRERPTRDIAELPLATQRPGPENRIETKQRSQRVRQAILALSPASRAALILREYEGLSYQEIAETLEIPVGTVMSRLNHARKQLRQSLATLLEEAV